MYFVISGGKVIWSAKQKPKALRWAAKYAEDLKCVAIVYDGQAFVKSFDGR